MIGTPFNQGSEAFSNDAPTASCQFPNGSTMHREWMDGWAQRQMRERAHRSRAMAEMNVQVLTGETVSGATSKLFRPIGEMD